MGSTSDWLKICFNQSEALPLSVTRHQYGISTLIPQRSFGGKTSGSVGKCRLFSQAVICTGTEDLTEAFIKNLSISTTTTKTTSLFLSLRESLPHICLLFSVCFINFQTSTEQNITGSKQLEQNTRFIVHFRENFRKTSLFVKNL